MAWLRSEPSVPIDGFDKRVKPGWQQCVGMIVYSCLLLRSSRHPPHTVSAPNESESLRFGAAAEQSHRDGVNVSRAPKVVTITSPTTYYYYNNYCF